MFFFNENAFVKRTQSESCELWVFGIAFAE